MANKQKRKKRKRQLLEAKRRALLPQEKEVSSDEKTKTALKNAVIWTILIPFVSINVTIVILFAIFVCYISIKGIFILATIEVVSIVLHMGIIFYLLKEIDNENYIAEQAFVEDKKETFFSFKAMISPYWIKYSNKKYYMPTKIYFYNKIKKGAHLKYVKFKGIGYYL